MRKAISIASASALLLLSLLAGAQNEKQPPRLPGLPPIPAPQPSGPTVSSGDPAPSASASTTPSAPPPPVTPAPTSKPATPPAPSAKPPQTPPKATPPTPSAPPKVTPPLPALGPAKKKAARPNAPPTPPPPGLAPPPPPPLPQPVFSSDGAKQATKDPPLAGFNEGFFLRDPSDYFRLYPRGRLHLDFHSFPGAPVAKASEGGVDMQPRFFARRIRLEFSGQALQRWTFTFGVDFGAQSESNTNGRGVVFNGSAADPNSPTARYAPIEGVNSTAVIANAFINYSFCPCLNVLVGQQQAPFSIENRTGNNAHTFMERNLPMRSFVAPNAKELGLTLWGDLFDKRLSYEMGVYMGDGQNRPQVDSYPDFIGRVFSRPLFGNKGLLDKAQIGASLRVGERDPKFVGYDYQPITTSQGYTLWGPTYKDSAGRLIHVIPSGQQLQVGGELRLPLGAFELRSEAYYVSNNTREAIDGTQLEHTERLGNMNGIGWYLQLSAWPWGDAFVNGDPGMWRPYSIDPNADPKRPLKGLEVVALVGGIHADYQGAARDGVADVNTPTAETGSKVQVLEYGFGINYWFTRIVRASVNYVIYHTPDSGTKANRALVPGNLLPTPNANEHLHHELGTRIGIGF